MEEYHHHPTFSMGKASKITRNAIHKFLQHYQYFTFIASLISLPFSISILISQSIIPHSFFLLPTIYGRLRSLLLAAGISPSSSFFSLFSLKLSQTICSSIITFPFSISFLLLAKSSIIHFYFFNNNPRKKPPSSSSSSSSSSSWLFVSLYNPILSTHVCNTFIIFAANATCFCLLFLAFNFLESLNLNSLKWVILFSVFGSVFYSVILANAIVVCNLALVSSGVEKQGGILSILKACVLIQGKTSTALALAVPVNLGLAAVEALFHFRIIESVSASVSASIALGLEGVLIAYIYSILLVLDVIMSCMFYQYCEVDHGFFHQISQGYSRNDHDSSVMEEVEEDCYYDYDCDVKKLKGLEEFV